MLHPVYYNEIKIQPLFAKLFISRPSGLSFWWAYTDHILVHLAPADPRVVKAWNALVMAVSLPMNIWPPVSKMTVVRVG